MVISPGPSTVPGTQYICVNKFYLKSVLPKLSSWPWGLKQRSQASAKVPKNPGHMRMEGQWQCHPQAKPDPGLPHPSLLDGPGGRITHPILLTFPLGPDAGRPCTKQGARCHLRNHKGLLGRPRCTSRCIVPGGLSWVHLTDGSFHELPANQNNPQAHWATGFPFSPVAGAGPGKVKKPVLGLRWGGRGRRPAGKAVAGPVSLAPGPDAAPWLGRRMEKYVPWAHLCVLWANTGFGNDKTKGSRSAVAERATSGC